MSKSEYFITIKVIAPDCQVFSFNLIAHLRHNVGELSLPIDFYEGVDLEFPHYEVEIVEPNFKRGQTGKLNYHYSDKDGLAYVCYPKRIIRHTLDSVLSVWAVGQVCVMTMDRYLNELIIEAGGIDCFLDWAKKYGICLFK